MVSVGVNAFAGDARSRLFYAANDARRMSAVLARRLAAVRAPETGRPRFEEVIPIVLITDAAKGGGTSPFLVDHATKDRVRAVLERLAGASDDGGRLAGVEGAARLRPARPEDFVLLYFSTHGEADARGRFYVMPSDLGPGGSAADVLRRAISSDELSAWLRPVDAGDLVMVLDTCQSAAAVDGGGFKPGPMGSRGLGQLAYDKGMVILAASQRDQSAIEAAQIRQGLLGYALVREGLEEGAADFRPSDERILLSEWLAYGSERVPGLYRAVHDGTLAAKGVEPVIEGAEPPAELQQPALFDFRHGLDRVLVETKGRPDARPPSPPATAGAKGARRLGAAAVAERWIPPGRIRIGPGDADGDRALSRDEVVAGFYLDRTEVTVEAYDACVRAGACSAPGKDPYCNEGVAARRKHPINCVSATQADAYCAWTGKRLPTEVEWEYAARGPGGRRFPWGEDPPSDQLCWNRHATASSATASTADSGTCEVGQYPDETFGLKDMGGNLTEWTSSPSRLTYASAWTDPSTRMIRGSSFANSTHGGAYSDELERAWHRERYTAHIGAGHIGFRCARGAR